MEKRGPSVVTKKGDGGETFLGSGSAVPKDDLRVEVYGTLDEAFSQIGLFRATAKDPYKKELLKRVQKKLIEMMGDISLARSREKMDGASASSPHDLTDDIALLEEEIKRLEEELPAIHEFIIPGENTASAQAHVARTVVRRAERLLVKLSRAAGKKNIPNCTSHMIYLNRLSDLLFLLAREEEGG